MVLPQVLGSIVLEHEMQLEFCGCTRTLDSMPKQRACQRGIDDQTMGFEFFTVLDSDTDTRPDVERR